MTISTTARLGITRWTSGADAFTRSDMDDSHNELESRVAGFDNGGSQPTAGAAKSGFFHYTTTDSAVGQLSYCNGDTYFDIAAPGTAVSLDGTLDDGTATTFARSDHMHSLDDSIVTTAKINDAAVTTVKIADSNVTNAKVASGLSASKLTTGTLPVARIADGAIATVKLDDGAVTDAKLASTGLDASKFTTGTLPTARIASNSISNAQIADMAANSVKVRNAGSTGNPGDLAIAANRVLGRDGSNNLSSTQIKTDMISTSAVSYAKMQNISSGYSILGKTGTGSGNVAEITAGTDSVLRRDGSGNLGFGKIDGNHITSNSITATQINANAVGSSELANSAVDTAAIQNSAVTGAKILNDTIALGTKTTGNYVATVSAGSLITVSGSGNENAEVTVNHATMTAPTPISNSNNGSAITSLTHVNGHITDYTYYDFDGRYLVKADAYGDSSANNGRRIYVQSGTPAVGSYGNLWFQI